MGQYWKVVNVDRREYLDPKVCGDYKLWEHLVNGVTGKALVILLANQPEMRGGGDLGYGVEEKVNFDPQEYIGRWVGDRVIMIGDYAENDDLAWCDPADVYEKISQKSQRTYKDISKPVMAIIQAEEGTE
jgi:hypothetical protein